MMNKLNVLIVEDDENDCKALVKEVNANADKLCVAGVMKSSSEAFEFIRTRKPHAVILDLELQDGSGDGMDLLDKLRSVVICPKPYIIVNTNSASKVTRNSAKKLGADYEFAKWQKGYSPQMVINQLLLVMPEILGEEEPPIPLTERQIKNKMRDFLQSKFNTLGLNVKNKGYNYLVDAVIIVANGEDEDWAETIAEKVHESKDSVSHAMQYAITRAWTRGDTTVLQEEYTAPIRKNHGVPSTTEFVLFFKQKLISYLN